MRYKDISESPVNDLAKRLSGLQDKTVIHDLIKRVADRHKLSGKALHALFLRKFGRDPFDLKTSRDRSLTETDTTTRQQQIRDFIKWTLNKLNIQRPFPKITLSTNTEKAQTGHHTGVNVPSENTIWIYIGNRNLIDIYRTIIHELTHVRQHQLNMIGPDDSYPGSPIEMLADMTAGKIIKLYSKEHPEIFESKGFTLESDEEHSAALNKTGFWGKQGAGCLFLAADTGRIGISHRSSEVEKPNTWGTIGGAIDSGEDPKLACKREVSEEAGYNGPLKLVPLFVFRHSSGFTYYNFLAIVKNEFTPRLDWENQGFDWFTFGKWPKPLHPGLIDLLNDPASINTIKKYLPKKVHVPALVTEGPADWNLPDPTYTDVLSIDKQARINKLTKKQQDAVRDYTNNSRSLNSALHQHYHKKKKNPNLSLYRNDIKHLDKVLSKHKLQDDLDVYTGLPESPAMAWYKYKQDRTKPIRLHLPAYTSTSPSFNSALDFAKINQAVPYVPTSRNKEPVPKKGKHMLLIHLPKGTPAGGVEDVSSMPGEHEIILPRGLEIMVDPHPTSVPNKFGPPITVWHADVVGHTPIQIAA